MCCAHKLGKKSSLFCEKKKCVIVIQYFDSKVMVLPTLWSHLTSVLQLLFYLITQTLIQDISVLNFRPTDSLTFDNSSASVGVRSKSKSSDLGSIPNTFKILFSKYLVLYTFKNDLIKKKKQFLYLHLTW